MSDSTIGENSNGPLTTSAASEGIVRACWASSSATIVSVRSAATTTTPDSKVRSSTCSIDMPATVMPSTSRPSSFSSPE